jgi:hypothetical protein
MIMRKCELVWWKMEGQIGNMEWLKNYQLYIFSEKKTISESMRTETLCKFTAAFNTITIHVINHEYKIIQVYKL